MIGVRNEEDSLDVAAMRREIEAQQDVREVLELVPLGGGVFLYLIETPFQTWPRYVGGTCCFGLEVVRAHFKCGLRHTADAAWQDLIESVGKEWGS